MKNENSTAPGAAPYSAPCCSRESRTAPGAVRIHDYSAPCCSQAHFEAVRTAPRAVLISITRRSPFSFVPLHRFGAVAPPLLLLTLCALPALRRLHPSHMSQAAPFAETGRALHGAHHLRPMHPIHHVHQCSRTTTTVRDHAGTAWNRGAVESLRRLGPRPTVPLSSRIHSWPDDPKGGAIEAE